MIGLRSPNIHVPANCLVFQIVDGGGPAIAWKIWRDCGACSANMALVRSCFQQLSTRPKSTLSRTLPTCTSPWCAALSSSQLIGGVAELCVLWRASLRAKSNRGGAGPPLLLALSEPGYAQNTSDFPLTLVEQTVRCFSPLPLHARCLGCWNVSDKNDTGNESQRSSIPRPNGNPVRA